VVEAVLLDAGGVLLLPNREEVGRVLGIGLEEIRRAHHAGMTEIDRRGRFDGSYWPAFLAGIGRRAAPKVIEHLSGIRWTTVIEESAEALRRLAERELAIAIVSNADGRLEQDLLANGVCQAGEGPGAPVAAVIDSAVVGVEKPDPRIFDIALERTGAARQRAIHVGDSVHFDVGGALAAGVRPLHLDPFGMCPTGGHDHVRSLADLLELV